MNEDDNKVVTLKVRVSPEFREKLVSTAKENNRSMNAEIVDRLEKSFSTLPTPLSVAPSPPPSFWSDISKSVTNAIEVAIKSNPNLTETKDK